MKQFAQVLMLILSVATIVPSAYAQSYQIADKTSAQVMEEARVSEWNQTVLELRRQAETVVSMAASKQDVTQLGDSLARRTQSMTTGQRLLLVNSLLEITTKSVASESELKNGLMVLSGVALLSAFIAPRLIEMRSKTMPFFAGAMATSALIFGASATYEHFHQYGNVLHEALLHQKATLEHTLILEHRADDLN